MTAEGYGMRAMRWLSRVFAAGLWHAVRAFTVLYAVVAAILAVRMAKELVGLAKELAPSLVVAAVIFSLVGVLVGILWCLSELAHRPPPAVPPGRQLVRGALRVLALGQIGAALLFAAVAGVKASRYVQGGTWEQNAPALLGFGLALGAVGQAYPDGPGTGAVPPSEPGASATG